MDEFSVISEGYPPWPLEGIDRPAWVKMDEIWEDDLDQEENGWFLYTHFKWGRGNHKLGWLAIKDSNGKRTGTRIVDLFWYGRRYGGVLLIWGERPEDTRVLRWGCRHYNHTAVQRNHVTKYKCPDCGAKWDIDDRYAALHQIRADNGGEIKWQHILKKEVK